MLIARPDYTPGWTWNRDWEQEKICFLKKKSLIGHAKPIDVFQILTAQSMVPCGTMVPWQAQWSDSSCPAQGRKVVSAAPVRTRYDLGSSSTFSFFLLLTSSFPNPLTLTQTLSCWNKRQTERKPKVSYGTWFLWLSRTWRTASTKDPLFRGKGIGD